jgi:hypothetical protein
MKNSLFLVALAVLASVTMACGITINLPVHDITAGPTRVGEIDIPEPDAKEADLAIDFGVGELRLRPGAENRLVTGTATYNVDDLAPSVESDGSKVRLEAGNLEIKGIPNFSDDIKNEWDFKLGDMSMNLEINAGAYEGDFELGGLALKSLQVGDGAANVRVRFSDPNPVEMDTLRYITGASTVELIGLANANFSSMIFRSGAGEYTLDFSGDLQRDAVVTIESGISQVKIIVPEGTSARVEFQGGLTNVNASGDWENRGGSYEMEGDGPTIIINVDMGAGNLDLRTK